MKTQITDKLYDYALSIAKDEHPVLKELRSYTGTIPAKIMQITADQGQFMSMIAKIMGAKKYLEIGVFTGYSALAVTLAMGENAITYALDIDSKSLATAIKFWQMAKVNHSIKPMLGNALDSLHQLTNEGYSGYFDLAFIDANKSDYIAYFDYCYTLVRAGGVILIDNIFMHGEVLDKHMSSSGENIDKFNHYIKQLPNIDYCVATIADGITICQKKSNYETT